MAKDAQAIAKKWGSNLAASTAAIQAGVEGVTVAPGQLAARQKNLYVQRVQENADKFARNSAAVSLTDWQAATVNKGIPRIATGATAAEGKFASFMGKLLPFIDQATRQLPARGTLDQNIARMTAFVRTMSQFKNT